MFLFFKNINIITSSFEITNSTGKLHKDFRTLFVFKHRRKTKKFTLKWQIPLIEKRVLVNKWDCMDIMFGQKTYLFRDPENVAGKKFRL